jgi:hypothetical protein
MLRLPSPRAAGIIGHFSRSRADGRANGSCPIHQPTAAAPQRQSTPQHEIEDPLHLGSPRQLVLEEIPLIFSRGIGSGLNRAITGIVVGGQTFSLLLTLLAVPVVYSYFDDAIGFARRIFNRKEPVDRGEAELDALLGGPPSQAAPVAEE